MTNEARHREHHKIHRSGWLRAAVLGANDGIVSTASLIVGVAAAETTRSNILVAGIAGMVAGAMSMAAGEYVSVKSQADTERADLKMEAEEIEKNFDYELQELAEIYVDRGLDPELARQVAEQMMAHDALGAHARDEIGISDALSARPLQAALASAATFAAGAFLPLLSAMLVADQSIIPVVTVASLVSLAILGAASAKTGGAPMLPAAWRVLFWGGLAMALTGLVGKIFGISL